MSYYFIRPPKAYRWLFKKAVFRENPNEKTVYLTFDDGPHPEATLYVLGVLKEEKARATFFLLGNNALAQPKLVEQIRKEGHAIGNHGMQHLSGWTTPTKTYVDNVFKAKEILNTSLFRPPYGRLGISQYNKLKTSEEIVFWDVLSGDFDENQSPKTVKDNVLSNVRNGSIILMHDSQKALPNLRGSLKETVQELKKKGYTFGKL